MSCHFFLFFFFLLQYSHLHLSKALAYFKSTVSTFSFAKEENKQFLRKTLVTFKMTSFPPKDLMEICKENVSLVAIYKPQLYQIYNSNNLDLFGLNFE